MARLPQHGHAHGPGAVQAAPAPGRAGPRHAPSTSPQSASAASSSPPRPSAPRRPSPTAAPARDPNPCRQVTMQPSERPFWHRRESPSLNALPSAQPRRRLDARLVASPGVEGHGPQEFPDLLPLAAGPLQVSALGKLDPSFLRKLQSLPPACFHCPPATQGVTFREGGSACAWAIQHLTLCCPLIDNAGAYGQKRMEDAQQLSQEMRRLPALKVGVPGRGHGLAEATMSTGKSCSPARRLRLHQHGPRVEAGGRGSAAAAPGLA